MAFHSIHVLQGSTEIDKLLQRMWTLFQLIPKVRSRFPNLHIYNSLSFQFFQFSRIARCSLTYLDYSNSLKNLQRLQTCKPKLIHLVFFISNAVLFHTLEASQISRVVAYFWRKKLNHCCLFQATLIV